MAYYTKDQVLAMDPNAKFGGIYSYDDAGNKIVGGANVGDWVDVGNGTYTRAENHGDGIDEMLLGGLMAGAGLGIPGFGPMSGLSDLFSGGGVPGVGDAGAFDQGGFDPSTYTPGDQTWGVNQVPGGQGYGGPDPIDLSTDPTLNTQADAINDLFSKVNASPEAKTVLGKILSGGTLNADDWGKIAGAVGSAGLGLFGSLYQSGQLKDLYNKFSGMGQTSRDRYEASFQPGFSMLNDPGYVDALNNTTNAILRGLSTKGNPYGNPGALIEANKQINSGLALPALYNYRNQNASTGGYGAFNTAAPQVAISSIGSDKGVFDAIGSGLSTLTNPQLTVDDLIKGLKNIGGYNFGSALI